MTIMLTALTHIPIITWNKTSVNLLKTVCIWMMKTKISIRKDVVVNGHEKLFNITLRHTFK